MERFLIGLHFGANSKCQLNTVWIDLNGAFQLEMKPQHRLILLHLA